MSPSSLIFVVVIATWAGYVVLHLARRREHLATARNVDRFSEHMRVLQRRAIRNAPRTRLKSSVHLLRTSPAEQRIVTERVLAPSGPAEAEAVPQPSPIGVSALETGDWPLSSPLPGPDAAADVAPGGSSTDVTEQPAITLTWPFAVLSGLATFSTRIFRAAAVAAVLGMTLLVGALVVVRLLPWWTLAISVAVIGTVLAWLPRAAHAERLARDRRRRARHYLHPRTRRRLVAEAAAAGIGQAGAPASDSLDAAVTTALGDADDSAAVAAVGATPAAVPHPDRIRTASRRRHRGADRPFDLLADDGGWTPVPVPPPTYTLKARAVHGGSAMTSPTRRHGTGVVPVPIDLEDDLDEVAAWAPAGARRAATGG